MELRDSSVAEACPELVEGNAPSHRPGVLRESDTITDIINALKSPIRVLEPKV